MLALLAALPLVFDLALGPAVTGDVGPVTPALQARAGVDLTGFLEADAVFLGVLGDQTSSSSCGSGCTGNASFSAYSLFAALRPHTTGKVQFWLEGGVGVGHLVSLSDDDLFEDPAIHGRGGIALRFGGGVRWFVQPTFSLGMELAWTSWSNLSRPAYTYGTEDRPADPNFSTGATLLLFSLGWSTGR
jgi:hypothetical protein